VTGHEVVIRFGHCFDVLIGDEYPSPPRKWAGKEDGFNSVTEIRVPFANRESAEAAQREITVCVRPVRNTGGEDYRPVVPGVVVREPAEIEGGAL